MNSIPKSNPHPGALPGCSLEKGSALAKELEPLASYDVSQKGTESYVSIAQVKNILRDIGHWQDPGFAESCLSQLTQSPGFACRNNLAENLPDLETSPCGLDANRDVVPRVLNVNLIALYYPKQFAMNFALANLNTNGGPAPHPAPPPRRF